MSRWIGMLLLVAFTTNALAFKCYITLVKGACWKNYDVNLYVSSPTNQDKQIVTLTAPKGKNWSRATFDCHPKQTLKLTADFSPVFWASDKGKIYNSLNYWNLPDSIKPGEKAWNVTMCFPKQFSEVPRPPEGSGKCACDLESVPKVPEQ